MKKLISFRRLMAVMVGLLFLTGTSLSGDEADAKASKSKPRPRVILKTTLGDITLELFNDVTPITVENFLNYVDSGFYDGTIFHRVINNFMIQGGGFTREMVQKKTEPPIKNEAHLSIAKDHKNLRGTIAMARTSVVDSATAQFFINVVDNLYLDHKNTTPAGYGYCVFGKVITGMETADKIKEVKTRPGDVPVDEVVILSAKRVD